MELLDEERLIAILQTSVYIVLGTKPMSSLVSTLLDVDEHVRTALISSLIVVFRRGMALNLDLEAFDAEIEKLFADKKLLSKALHQYWRKNGASLTQQYQSLCPIDDRLVDLKWVAVLPSDSKHSEEGNACVECQFTTTKGSFAMDFTSNGLNQLAVELNSVLAAVQELK